MPVIPVNWKAEAGGPQVQSQPGQLNEILSQNKIKRDGDIVQW
jgi:hypothetical protein